jgi:hypothetical protein
MFLKFPCASIPTITLDNRQYTVFHKDTADRRIRTCCSQFNWNRTQKKAGNYRTSYVLSFMYIVMAFWDWMFTRIHTVGSLAPHCG